MLVIKSLKLKINEGINLQSNQLVRLCYNQQSDIKENHYYSAKKQCLKVYSNIFEWIQNITIPIYFNREIKFEIYKKSSFDYPSEESQKILKGCFVIKNFKDHEIQAKAFDGKNQFIGVLVIYFQIINQKIALREDNTKGTILISSLLIHFRQNVGVKGYCQINLQNQSFKTSEILIIVGQLLWTEPFSIKYSNIDNSAINFNIYIDGQFKYRTKLNIQGFKSIKYQKISLYNLNNEKSGKIIIDLKKQEMKKSPSQQLPSIRHIVSQSNSTKKIQPINSKSHKFLYNPQFKILKQAERKTNNMQDIDWNIFHIGDEPKKGNEKIDLERSNKIRKRSLKYYQFGKNEFLDLEDYSLGIIKGKQKIRRNQPI